MALGDVEDAVSNYCADHLHDLLAQEWKEAVDEDGWKHRWETAILRAYERADDAFKDGPDTPGSTAVVVVLSACQIIVGNCGDSRAVLCRGDEAIPLTVDHKPNREDEVKRITNAGGKVLYTDCERVEGVLSMTRAIGDHFLKPWVISVPEVTFMARSEEDEFLIMASDGLWDVMTSEEAVKFASLVHSRLQKWATMGYDGPAKIIAKGLLASAIKKGSCDNISVIFIDLSMPRRRKKPHKEPEASQA
ncbi:protein phosphatase 2C 56-like [Syzygium oleosum]|uniref:protein phosphatase 2C 56-like n=1 Tax=Syzygium oleosum TaxID=219896 RepID=UPI0024B9B39F|nr:protein phosphatase 2C 56-like [Syzygium oleosum]